MSDKINVPPVRDPDAPAAPESDQRNLVDSESSQSSHAPKTSGAPQRGKEPLIDKLADRNVEGPREAGVTPRPTVKPIVDGDRGA